jgi:hypothetical protein
MAWAWLSAYVASAAVVLVFHLTISLEVSMEIYVDLNMCVVAVLWVPLDGGDSHANRSIGQRGEITREKPYKVDEKPLPTPV